ncbi:MAG: porphobilinogen synthase, partial [Leptospiraceae bacterium]|nr:porphobilinogen synthase [Leptospiraceae bacterium]
MIHITQRPRRNRRNQTIRDLTQETWLNKKKLIYPLFLLENKNEKQEIASMPGIFRLGLNSLCKEIEECLNLGISSFILFPVVDDSKKDSTASYSYLEENFYLHSLRYVKEKFPEACIITDVAMDPYSSDGHDGLVENGKIINDKTLEILGRMAIAQAQTGIDYIGPSD